MTDTRCDLAVIDEQLAINVAGRSDGQRVTISIGPGGVPDTGFGLHALIAGSGTR